MKTATDYNFSQDLPARIRFKKHLLAHAADTTFFAFSMFTLMEAHPTHTKGGLGIGLTLVERLVKLHDGKVYARSDGLDRGSEFEVLLPRADGSHDRTSDGEDPVQRSSDAMRVLIVDDNPDVTAMLDLFLRKSEHETRVASSGKEAMQVAMAFKPDVALLDIGTPDIDGYELCEKLTAAPETSDTVFRAQSGWSNKEYKEKALAVGFKEYFVKPLDSGAGERAAAVREVVNDTASGTVARPSGHSFSR